MGKRSKLKKKARVTRVVPLYTICQKCNRSIPAYFYDIHYKDCSGEDECNASTSTANLSVVGVTGHPTPPPAMPEVCAQHGHLREGEVHIAPRNVLYLVCGLGFRVLGF
jgi:hypothetical protein